LLTADALRAFAVGLVPFSLYLYAMRGFYALRDTRTPFVINCLENALNVVFAAVLYPHFGIRGLAYGFSAAYAVSAVVALVVLRNRLGGIDGRRSLHTAAKAAVAALALAAASAAVAHVIDSPLVAVIVAGLAGAVVYLAVLQGLGSDEIKATIAAVRRSR
jgi:putative peptidoglycan lipid II flippase